MSAVINAEAFEHQGIWLFRTFQPLPKLTDGPSGEMQIALSRTWEGGPGGKPLTLDASVFEQMIANFNARENRAVVVDIDHRAFNKQSPSTEAAGWITGLSIRQGADGPELWANVDWTQESAAKIKAGNWRFCSPSFSMSWVDPETKQEVGANLLTVSLTNTPFQDGLAPIRLSMVGAADEPDADDMPPQQMADKPDDAPAASDKPAADAAPAKPEPPQADPPKAPIDPMPTEQENARVALMNGLLERIAKAAQISPDAALAMMVDDGDAIASRIASKAQQDGTPAENRHMSTEKPNEENPTAPEVKPPVTEPKPDDAEAKFVKLEMQKLQETVTQLSTDLETIKATEKKRADDAAAAHESKIQARVEQFIHLGHIAEAEKDDAIALYRLDYNRADRAYSRGKVVLLNTSQAGPEPKPEDNPVVDPSKATADDLTKEERVVFLSMQASGAYGSDANIIRTLVGRREARAEQQGRINALTN